ncbi:MAG: EAL domain-containing protein [Nakamurella sp.]
MSDWSGEVGYDDGLARSNAEPPTRSWSRVSIALDVADSDMDPRLTTERLGILNAIIRASVGSDSLVGLLDKVLDAVCRRYPGLRGAVACFDGSEVVLESVRPPRSTGVDWADIFVGVPTWAADRTDGFQSIVLEKGGKFALAVLLPPDSGQYRAIAFVDPEDVVDFPQGVLAVIAMECTYVVDREVRTYRLMEREEQLRAVFDASTIPQALLAGDRHEFTVVNDALCQLVGYARDELVGKSARSITHPDDVRIIEAACGLAAENPGGQHRVERRLIGARGDIIYTETTLTWLHLPGGRRMLLQQIADITAQRNAERHLLEQAETDGLTGIGNRLHLVRKIDELDRSGEEFGVVFLDVDSFKSINDARGHEIGDEILIEVAARLAAAARPEDLVVRFGGDEFVVLCRETASLSASPETHRDPRIEQGDNELSPLAQAVWMVADRAQRVLAEPIGTTSGPAHITVSIGVCDNTIPVAHAIDRLQHADTAAYRAKRLGQDRKVVYDAGLHRQTTEHRRVEVLLRTALEEERFVVHYQPIVDIADGRPVGIEALVRLRDRNGHLVAPGRFIHVAERSGLIVPMGSWVLAESCRTAADLRRKLHVPIHVSVNVAARQASRSDLVDVVDAALDAAGLPPDALTLELTESALLEADVSTLARLHDMSARGIEIALDDFGTGYSSLTYLRQLPVTRIKVDQSFVGAMTTDSGSAAIVKAVTMLAHDLGLTWVAEGVETAEQWERLKELGAGLAQGYYFARPQPKEMLEHILTSTINAAVPTP